MRSPVALALCTLLGLALGTAYPVGFRSVLGLGSLAFGTLVTCSVGRSAAAGWLRLTPWLLCGCACFAGMGLARLDAPPSALPPQGQARMVVDVERVRHDSDGRARSLVRVLSGERIADGARIPSGTRLWAGPYALPDGARLQLLAAVHADVAFRNPSPHQTPAPGARGHATLAAADAFATLEHPWSSRLVAAGRAALRQGLTRTLPSDAAAVSCALLLGDTDALEPDDTDAVRGAGLSHVFAVSGMHVSLLAGLGVLALRRVLAYLPLLAARVPVQRTAAALGVPWALAIALFTGGSASGWRASITTAIAWTLVALGRKPSTSAVAAAACIVFAGCSPGEALSPGFVLSIAATAAIISDLEPGLDSVLDVLRAAGRLALRTALATAPIVWWSFGSVPLVGVLANMCLVPLGSALLLLAAAHALLLGVAPFASTLTAAPLTAAARAFLQGAASFAALDPKLVLPPPTPWQAWVAGLAAAGILLARTRRMRWSVAALGLALGLAGEWRVRSLERPRDAVRVTFVDVGQGDATLIDLPDGRAMLVDGGGNPSGGLDPGGRALVPLLQARRRAHLDVVVLTHPHPDHYGGLRAVLDAVSVGELWDSGQSELEAGTANGSTSPGSPNRTAHALVQQARARGVRVLRPGALCARPRDFGGARIEVLWPCPAVDAGYDPNDNSLVLRVQYGARSLLLTGDIESHAERELIARRSADLRAEVLKVAHHGSRTSSSAGFLAAVAPRLAVISAGAVNAFGHPHAEVVQRLRQHAREVIDLGLRGGTIVTLDAAGMRLEPQP